MKRSWTSCDIESDYSDSDEDSLSTHSSAQHKLLKPELQGHVTYDDLSVFKRLRIDEQEDAIIDRCHEIYQATQRGRLEKLLEITRGSLEEGSVQVQSSSDTQNQATNAQASVNAEAKIEKLMYQPLSDIFAFLQGFGDSEGNTTVLREFKLSPSATLLFPPVRAAEAYTPGIAKFRPDFDLLDKNANGAFWDRCYGFAEIKVKAEENARPLDDASVKDAVAQCADYARYHMAFRPFWNFSVTLLITGMKFRVMIVDRDGVVLSPLHDVSDDTDPAARGPNHQPDARTFVRVVRALTRHLTDRELGQDPSVTPITRNELDVYLQSSSTTPAVQSALALEDGDHYPSYRIHPFGNAKRTWCTVGPPIWASLSLRGRGTEVWRVVELVNSKKGRHLTGDIHVMKTSWRSPQKIAESEVYGVLERLRDSANKDQKLPPFPLGVAKYLYGSDVFYDAPPQAWVKMTIAHIRGYEDDPNQPSKVLHRIILSNVGAPLWMYTDELQFLKAIRAIIEAHQYLCENGILHRDMSAGNMLLWLGGDVEGFVCDFDLAEVSQMLNDHLVIQEAANPVKGKPGSIRTKINFTSSRPYGVPVTGTLQFMALDLLRAADRHTAIPHTSAHDLESIAYVLGYAVLRRLVSTPGCPDSLEKAFKTHFGGMTVGAIILQRATLQPLSWNYSHAGDPDRRAFVIGHVSSALSQVFSTLQLHLGNIHSARETRSRAMELALMYDDLEAPSQSAEEPITHTFFLGVVNQAITTLEHNPSLIKRFNLHQGVMRPLKRVKLSK